LKHSTKLVLGKSNFGDWGSPFVCTPGHFVIGYQQKVFQSTAFNKLKVKCSDGKTGTSAQIDSGDWSDVQKCPPGEHIIGFNLRSSESGTEDIRMRCSGGLKLAASRGVSSKDGNWDCNENNMCNCPTGFALCGIQTQVAQDKGMNQIGFICCPVKSSEASLKYVDMTGFNCTASTTG